MAWNDGQQVFTLGTWLFFIGVRMSFDWAQDIPSATAQTRLSGSPPFSQGTSPAGNLHVRLFFLVYHSHRWRNREQRPEDLLYQGHIANSLHSWTLPQSFQSSGTPLSCTPHRHFKKKQVLGRQPETPKVQKNFSVCPATLKAQPSSDPGQVQSDLLSHNMDQTLLLETARISVLSLPAPLPVQIDFVLPVFLCLTKKAEVTCCQWRVAKTAKWPLKKITCFKFPTAVQSLLSSRHCIMLIIC